MAGDGMLCKHVADLELHHVRIETRQGPALRLEDARDVEIHSLAMKRRHAATPVVRVARSEDVFFTGRQSSERNYVEEDVKEVKEPVHSQE
ncbi:hypothetical protein D3C84_1151400 [compost metagenome]